MEATMAESTSDSLEQQQEHRHVKSVTASDAEFLEMVDTTATASDRIVDLHKSNLLRLQMDELYKETVLSLDDPAATEGTVKWSNVAAEYVQDVSNILQSLDLSSNMAVEKNSCPFTMRSDKPVDKLSCRSPQAKLKVQARECFGVSHIGLTKPAGNAQVLPTLNLDVMIPTASLLEPKDYMKHRYFEKRNIVIWHVARQLTSRKKLISTVGKVYWRGTPDHPTLLLIPPVEEGESQQQGKSKRSKKDRKTDDKKATKRRTKKLRFRVELHFCMDSVDWIQPLIRLVPNRCNLGSEAQQSLMYNYRLTNDALHLYMNDQIGGHKNILKDAYPRWNEVVVLAKIWCLQRGLLNRHDGLTVEQLALLVLYLYRNKLASPRMAAQQVMASLFKVLAETDWLGENASSNERNDNEDADGNNLIRKAPHEGYQSDRLSNQKPRTVLVLPSTEGQSLHQTVEQAEMAEVYARQTAESPLTPDDPKTLLQLYETSYTLGPVFLDSSMTHNFFGNISPSCIRMIQREAKKGLDYLHSATYAKPFQLLFMTEVRFFKRFDAYMQIPLKDLSFQKSSIWGGDRLDLGDYECLSRGLVGVLKRALGDRVRDIQLLSTGNGSLLNSTNTGVEDSDEIQTFSVVQKPKQDTPKAPPSKYVAPNGQENIIIGILLKPDTCFRIVDRGPPADDVEATRDFLDLWGSDKAELRRFKDGAIVHAVVWDDTIDTSNEMNEAKNLYTRYLNDDKVQGGIAERIVRHILRLHFVKKKKAVTSSFALRNILSTVDAVIPGNDTTVSFNPLVAHRLAMRAFEDLSTFLRKESLPSVVEASTGKKRSPLGIPLPIDAVEALDPSLRYSSLFPPIPHPLLGGSPLPGIHKVSGVVCSSPIRIQVRFGSSSKWPTDMKAMGAAKTAMLIQLVEGIEELKRNGLRDFRGPTNVTPEHADISYKGYVFRVIVRADPELKYLRELVKPSDDAVALLKNLKKKHVTASRHHSMVHAVYNSHPSSSMVVRMAHRWVETHLLSGLIPFEAVELMVSFLYTSKNHALDPPGSVVAGVLRFFELFFSHDWENEPLIVDPHEHLDDEDHIQIGKDFDRTRGEQRNRGPAMFVVAAYDQVISDGDDNVEETTRKSATQNPTHFLWKPTYTIDAPETVVLTRARQLAKRTHSFLSRIITSGSYSSNTDWYSLFHESTESFRAYSALLRVDNDFILENESSSSTAADLAVQRNEKLGVWQSSYTRSMYCRYYGPESMQIKLYKNLIEQQETPTTVLLEWNAVEEMVGRFRILFGQLAVFWYNRLCPEVVAILWRPNIFSPKSFSAVASEYARPLTEDNWQKDTLVTVSVSDIMREISCISNNIVVAQNIFDNGLQIQQQGNAATRKRKDAASSPSEDSSSQEEDDDAQVDEESVDADLDEQD